jgi:epoxide hydrolase 4
MHHTVTHLHVTANGLTLHVAGAGDATNPLVILLHGFPEFWFGWRNQLPALATSGFHAVAPDLPGYGMSEKPRDLDAYRVPRVSDAFAALIHALGYQRAHVIGHDWGGLVAWDLAMHHPDVVDRLVVLNTPHPSALSRALRTPRQWLRSSYMLFFQLPWLPERLLATRDYALLRWTLRHDPVRAAAFSDTDLSHYVSAWSEPDALTGGLNYYRAAFRRRPPRTLRTLQAIERPTLVIWGDRDRYLLPRLAEPDQRWVPRATVRRIPFATHWVASEFPDYVNRLITEFLHSEDGGRPSDTDGE